MLIDVQFDQRRRHQVVEAENCFDIIVTDPRSEKGSGRRWSVKIVEATIYILNERLLLLAELNLAISPLNPSNPSGRSNY